MGKTQPLPILITGGGRRIGLALAWHFINQKQPVIVSYRTHYPAIDGLINAGAQCIQADFSTNDGVMAFADEVLKSTHGLRAILHNASAWMAEKPGAPLADVLACMMQIHVNTPYLLNHALERLLRGHGHAASDIDGKETGTERTHRAGIKLNAGRGCFQSAAKYGGSCQPGSTAHRLGYYWRWHFIAGLCHADPHAHSSRT